MSTITFELPEILWRVTKLYSTKGVRQEHIKKVESSTKYYYFKDINLAQEFYSQFTWDYIEFVAVGMDEDEEVGYELNVIMKIEKVYSTDLIPDIIDL